MKFIAHSHYNNNSDGLGDFESPYLPYFISEVPVNITDQGITIFLLSKHLNVEDKLKMIGILHRRLKESERHGFDFVTCATSDCVQFHQLAPFYAGVKEIDQNMATLWVGDARSDFTTDYRLDFGSTYGRTNSLIPIIDPKDSDKTEPAEGWKAYDNHLRMIYNDALEEAFPGNASAPSMHQRHGLHLARLQH